MIQRLLLTLLTFAPLIAFGGAYRWLTVPLAALTALTLLANVSAVVAATRGQRALDAALVTGCLLLALQLVPLPPAWVQVLSPDAAHVRSAVRLDYPFTTASWYPLSTNPEATWHALGVAASATVVFFIARGVFAVGGIRRWCRTLALVGLAVSILAVIQRATSPELIYGFWRPLDPNARPFGPFVNRNHFAGWLLMTGFVVAGYVTAHARIHLAGLRRDMRRLVRTAAAEGTPIYVTAALVIAITTVLTLSRSALAGFAAGAVAAAAIARRRFESRRVTQAGYAVAMIAIAAFMVFGFVDLDQLARRADETVDVAPGSRMAIWRETLGMTRDFWATGVGAGAYASAILAYQPSDQAVHFNQAHSHYLQLATEGGVMLTVPWLVAAVLFARKAVRALARDTSEIFSIRLGAVSAVVAIAVQSIWETPLRMGANAVLFALVSALAIHRRSVNAYQSQRIPPPTTRAA